MKSDKHSFDEQARILHKKLPGKIELSTPFHVRNVDDLSVVYSPGVAAPCRDIAENIDAVYDYTMKGRTVAVVSDGSAVLGLGNIGAEAGLPVMEGKAMLFKQFAGLDAVPLCLNTQESQEIISIVKALAPNFGGINLEDISAPRCFEIEEALQDIGIPVFHDDQHGTAIVVLAGLINAAKVAQKDIADLKVVIQGAGAAGVAIARLLSCIHDEDTVHSCIAVKDIIVCDSKGIISKNRDDLNTTKQMVLEYTNEQNRDGSLVDALQGADVLIGVSVGNTVTKEMVESMNNDPIIFALANPTPEISPEDAREAGALVVATGRSDYPNQINNVLAFPGIFKGALAVRAPRITTAMKYAAAYALANLIPTPTADKIIPDPFHEGVAENVAQAIIDAHNDSQ